MSVKLRMSEVLGFVFLSCWDTTKTPHPFLGFEMLKDEASQK